MKTREWLIFNQKVWRIIGPDTDEVCVIEKSAYDELKRALNKIAILGSSEMAYTSDFTESVNVIAREALGARIF